MDTMLDLLCAHAKGARLLFSDQPFPDAVKLVWQREDQGGNWYRCPELNDHEGWLCPALAHYFDQPPKKLYVQLTALSAADAESLAGRRSPPSLAHS